jgi:hypothetical protein
LLASVTYSPANPFPDSYAHPEVWHMMFSTGLADDPATYHDIPNDTLELDTACGLPVPGYSSWLYEPNTTTTAQAGINTSSNVIKGVVCAPGQALPPLKAFVHPGSSNLVVIAWQSPISSTVTVTGRFADDDCGGGNGIAWNVDLASDGHLVSMDLGAYTNCGQSSMQFSATVAVGDYLYFIVNPNGDYGFDLTEIDVAITCN